MSCAKSMFDIIKETDPLLLYYRNLCLQDPNENHLILSNYWKSITAVTVLALHILSYHIISKFRFRYAPLCSHM